MHKLASTKHVKNRSVRVAIEALTTFKHLTFRKKKRSLYLQLIPRITHSFHRTSITGLTDQHVNLGIKDLSEWKKQTYIDGRELRKTCRGCDGSPKLSECQILVVKLLRMFRKTQEE